MFEIVYNILFNSMKKTARIPLGRWDYTTNASIDTVQQRSDRFSLHSSAKCNEIRKGQFLLYFPIENRRKEGKLTCDRCARGRPNRPMASSQARLSESGRPKAESDRPKKRERSP